MSGVFARLAANEAELLQVTTSIENVVARSFETHRMQHITRAEVKRRFDLCARIFERLRGDLSWGLARIFDRMPEYLAAELNGSTWTPDARACWFPQDGR